LKRIILAVLAAVAATAALVLPAGAASAGNHTIGCAVNPFCFDIYNTQLGPGDTLKVIGNPAAGDAIKLEPRNGQDAGDDSLFIPVGNVTTTLNCPDPACDNSVNFPFTDPNVDLQFIQFGDTLVFSEQDAPNGHLAQLFYGLNAKGQLSLQFPGVYGSQAYQNRLWVTSPFFQINGSFPVINVGRTNATGIFKVLGVKDGALVGARPRIQTGQLDSLGQAPENQDWQIEPNYP